MSYSNGLQFLESKTKVLELTNEFGARIAICPAWNGRVMTSTCGGIEGDSYGLIDVHSIETDTNQHSLRHCFGGEDQFTLSPNGGPFSLYYDTKGSEGNPASALADYQESIQVPTGFVEGPFEVDFGTSSQSVRMRRTITATNISGARFDLDVVRSVRLLNEAGLQGILPDAAIVPLEQPEVSFVAYESSNTIFNRGAALSKNSGLVSIRVRGMFNATPYSVMLLPFRPGNEDELGPPIQSEFFGVSSRKRLHILNNAAVLRADGLLRGQIGVSRRRAIPHCAAIDFRTGVLTILAFNMPDNPVEHDYLSNDYFEPGADFPQSDFLSTREYYFKNSVKPTGRAENETVCANELFSVPPTTTAEIAKEHLAETPFSGEVVRAYNHGSLQGESKRSLPFFELDTYSPAKEMQKGESITHNQYTIHIFADSKTLEYLLRTIFNVDANLIFSDILK